MFPHIVSLCLPDFEMQAVFLLIIKGKSSKIQGHVPRVTLLLCEEIQTYTCQTVTEDPVGTGPRAPDLKEV